MFFNNIQMIKVVCKGHGNQPKFKFKDCFFKRFEIPPAWGLNFVPLLERFHFSRLEIIFDKNFLPIL